MTIPLLLTTLYKDLHLPNELKGALSTCLGIEIPVEAKEKVDINKITIQIENALSGKILLYLRVNKNNTIKEMKEQVKKSLESKQEETLYDVHVYNENRDKITNDESDKIEELFKEDDYPILAVSFTTVNLLTTLIEKYPNKNWSWSRISCNHNITMEIIEKYPNKPWEWDCISWNPNLTIEMLEKYPNKPWQWGQISRNPNITMEIIEKHPNKPWEWDCISWNPNLTIEMLEKYPNKPWDWRYISCNPNITMEIIEKNKDKIDFCSLSYNKFNCVKK
jgi:hypothetical protein